MSRDFRVKTCPISTIVHVDFPGVCVHGEQNNERPQVDWTNEIQAFRKDDFSLAVNLPESKQTQFLST